jgi:hypothetical protein
MAGSSPYSVGSTGGGDRATVVDALRSGDSADDSLGDSAGAFDAVACLGFVIR